MTRRTPKGAGIVEGVVGLAMVIGGGILAVLLIINTGTAMYMKNKVAFASEQMARYAASETDTAKRDAFKQDLITKMGLPSGTTINLEDTQLGSQDAVKATATATSSTLLKADWLPETISMTDSSVAASSSSSGVVGYLLAPTSGGATFMQQGAPAIPLVKLPAPAALGAGIPGYAPMGAGSPPYGFQITTVMNLQK